MISSWLFSEKTAKVVAVFDIGSSSIGSALILTGGGKPEIVYANRIAIPFQTDIEPEKLTKSLLLTLVDAALDLKTVGLMRLRDKKVSAVYEANVVFASPWSASQNIPVHIKKDKPFVVTKELLDAAVEAETARLKVDAPDSDMPVLIEKHAVGVALNGYHFLDPYGKKTTSADINTFVSFIPKSLEEKVKEVIQGTFPGARMHAHSFPMVFFSGIRDIYQDIGSALLVEVRGEITDISIMANGALSENMSFPVGEHTLLRMLTENSARMPEEEKSRLRLYLEGRVKEPVSDALEKQLASLSGIFEMSFKKSLQESVERSTIPQDLILASEGESGPWFASELEKIDMSDLVLGAKTPKVHSLTASELTNAYTASSEVRPDPFIILSAMFVDKFFSIQ